MNDDVCYKTKLWKFDFEVGRSFASARSPERKKKFLDIVISTKKKKEKPEKTEPPGPGSSKKEVTCVGVIRTRNIPSWSWEKIRLTRHQFF